MTSEVILDSMKKKLLYNVITYMSQVLIKLDFKQKLYQRKFLFFDKKLVLCDLE